MRISFVQTEADEERFFIDSLPEHETEFVSSLDEVDPEAEAVSVFVHSLVSTEFLNSHPELRLVLTRSAAREHIDEDACARRRVAVRSVPHYGDYTVAEHAIALLFAVARRLRFAANQGNLPPAQVRGVELRGRTLGILGAGRVGLHVAEIARALRMQVIAFDRRRGPGGAGVEYASFEEVLERADALSLHLPLTPETYHILNREAFARVRPGLLLVNTARGRLIDTDALVEALDLGLVGGAGLDVLEDERVLRQSTSEILAARIVRRLQQNESAEQAHQESRRRLDEVQRVIANSRLLARPEVIFTPHVAFNTEESFRRINTATVENIRAFVAGA